MDPVFLFFNGFQPQGVLLLFLIFNEALLMAKITPKVNSHIYLGILGILYPYSGVFSNNLYTPIRLHYKDGFDGGQVILLQVNFKINRYVVRWYVWYICII